MTPRPEPTAEALAAKPEVDAYDLLLSAVDEALAAGVVHPTWDRHLVAQILWGSLHGVVALHLVMPTKSRVELLPLEVVTDVTSERLTDAFSRPAEQKANLLRSAGDA